MPHDDDLELENLMRELRSYLEQRPNAADTFEGVLLWWIKRQRYESSAKAVKKAIDELVRQGEIEEREGQDGKIVYFKR